MPPDPSVSVATKPGTFPESARKRLAKQDVSTAKKMATCPGNAQPGAVVVAVQAVDLRTDILQPDQIRFPLELGQLVNRKPVSIQTST